MRYLPIILCVSLGACFGCGDETPSQVLPARDMGVDQGAIEDASPAIDAQLIQDMTAPPPDAAIPEPGWMEVELRPRRSQYVFTDAVQAEAKLLDIFGDPIVGTEVAFTITPAEIATIDAQGALSFVAPGSGTVTACVGDLCAETHFLVDDGPPRLEITSPARGAAFVGADNQTITIAGTVTDATPGVRVLVNGVDAEIAEDGTFSLQHEAVFGMNQLRIIADDGVSREIIEDIRDILWAPSYAMPQADRVVIPNVAAFRMDQTLFDGGEAIIIPDEAAVFDVDSIAQLLEIIFALVDVEGLLNAEDLFGEQGGGFNISGAELGAPTIDFEVSPNGLQLFVRFGDVQIHTDGEIDLQGQAVDLTGTIDLSIVARIDVTIGLADRVIVEVGESAVVVESISANFAAAGLGALINAASAGITGIIEEAFTEVVDDVLRAQISDFIRSALLGIFGDLREVPVQIDPMLAGVSPIDLTLGLTVSAIEMVQRTWIRFRMDLAVIHTEAPTPREDDPGVPQLTQTDWPGAMGDGLGIALRLSLFNSLLHEVWRGGVLTLEAPLPEELSGLIERVNIDARLAPLVVPAQSPSVQPLEMQLGELMIRATRPESDLTDTYVLSIRSGMSVQFLDNRFQLVLDAVPTVTSQLLDAQSEMPLPKALIESALRGLVWDQLREALTGGFDFGFSAIDIDPATLAEFAPRLDALAAVPTLQERLDLRENQLRLEGNLGVRIGLLPAPPPPMEEMGPGEAPEERGGGR
jgi:hypothetical protein